MIRFAALLFLLAALLSACRAPATSAPSSTATDSSAPVSTQTAADQTNPPQTEGEEEAWLPYDLILSEVMPDNERLVLGHDLDWVELHNRESSALSLDAYFLTDDLEKPYDLSLTGMTIPAHGYLVIVLDTDAAFRLSALGETVYLTHKGKVVSSLSFPAPEDGESYSPEGACAEPTPGFPNTPEGYLSYLDSLTLPDLIISEVISSNRSHLPYKGECFDIVEIQNRSSSPIDLSEYTLSDKRKEPARYQFPAITLGAGECYVVFCSGAVSLGDNHASFKISSSGETVYLSKNGILTDLLTVPGDLPSDESYGRQGNRPVTFADPTPGEANPMASTASGISHSIS